jgi:NADPH-dependent ferric siderophore reductase
MAGRNGSVLTAARASRRHRTHVPLRFYDVEVRAVRAVTPHMLRITFGGPGLVDFADDGPDQRCKLFLPRADGSAPTVPRHRQWFATLRTMPEAERPIARTYTIRAARPWCGEVDIDFSLHGFSTHDASRGPARDAAVAGLGPATAWARRARPGERAVLWGAWAEYDPPPAASWQLIAGDDTALPAIGAILERLPAGTPAHVVIEVADAAARQPLPTRATAVIHWTHRADAGQDPDDQGPDGRRDAALLSTLRGLTLPAGMPYAWVAGESSMVTAVRRYLVHERGVPAAEITFMGYWRHGGPIEPRVC